MTDHPPPGTAVTSLDAVLYDWANSWSVVRPPPVMDEPSFADLRTRLIAREDNIADHLRLAGAQFGAIPAFVAEVICQTGLGTQPSADERLHIHNQFHIMMSALQVRFPELFRPPDDSSDV